MGGRSKRKKKITREEGREKLEEETKRQHLWPLVAEAAFVTSALIFLISTSAQWIVQTLSVDDSAVIVVTSQRFINTICYLKTCIPLKIHCLT